MFAWTHMILKKLWEFWNSKTIKSITSADDIGQAHCFQIPILEFCITRKRKRKSKLFAVPTSWKVELFFPNRQICVVDIQSYHIYVHLIWFLNNNVVLIHIVYSISFVIATILLRISRCRTLQIIPLSMCYHGQENWLDFLSFLFLL